MPRVRLHSSKKSSRYRYSAERITDGLLLPLLIVAVVILLGGGASVSAQAAATLGTGLILLRHPPSKLPPGWLLAGFAALGLSFLFGLLPIGELVHGNWRSDLRTDHPAVNLPFGATIHPWPAWERLMIALTGAFWIVWVINRDPEREGVREVLWFCAMTVALLSIPLAIGILQGWTYPLASEAGQFSYFPNRNQTGIFLALGGILSLGLTVDAFNRKHWRKYLGIAFLFLILPGLLLNGSRASFVLFTLGAAYLFLVPLLGWRTKKSPFALGLIATAVICLVLLIVGGRTIDRVEASAAQHFTPLLTDARLTIYQDALRMSLDQPWLGPGLGSFSYVFGQYRMDTRVGRHARHPENDWLWLATEMGWPVTLAFVAAVGWLLLQFVRTQRQNPSLHRLVPQAALIAFLGHTFVDVSAHRLGTSFFAMLLLGVSLPWHQYLRRTAFLPRIVPQLAGFTLVAAGGTWLVAGIAGLPLHSQIATAEARAELRRAIQNQNPDEGVAAALAMQRIRPLEWEGYFGHGSALLSAPVVESDVLEEARSLFRSARFLSRPLAQVPLREALIWSRFDVGHALHAARVAIRRQPKTDRELITGLRQLMQTDSKVRAGLWQILQLHPDLRLHFLLRLDGDDVAAEINADIATHALTNYPPEARLRLLLRMIDLGQAQAILTYLSQHPEKAPMAWRVEALAYHAMGQYQSAVELIRKRATPPELPTISGSMHPSQLKRFIRRDPTDILSGVALLKHQFEQASWEDARETLKIIKRPASSPPYLEYYLGEVEWILQDMEAASAAYARYLRRSPAFRIADY